MKTGLMSLPALIGEALIILLMIILIGILAYHGLIKVTGSQDYLREHTQRLAQEEAR